MKTTRIIIAVLCILALSGWTDNLIAQPAGSSFLTYKGTLKDSKTKKEIVFANVSLPGTHVGTITNSDGGFTLKVQNSLNATSIEFSRLGYTNKIVEISTLKPEGNVIFLDAASVPLEEVTVRPDDPRSIVQAALERVGVNYSTSPGMFTGFYRETIRQRNDYISISEAVVDIYKASYTQPNEEDRTRVFKGRKSANVKKADTLVVKLQGGPSVSLMLDVAKYPYLLEMEGDLLVYDFIFEDMVNVDNKLNYVISFKQKSHVKTPLYKGSFYIETKSLAFTMIQFELNLENKEEVNNMLIRRKPAGVKVTPTAVNYMVNYKEKDGIYYFNYARNELSLKCNWRRRIFSSNYTTVSELAVTDRDLVNVTRFPYRDAFKRGDILADGVAYFNDADFWGEHNYIEPDESIEAAIKRYGKRLLREQ
jgi:hypothetical protein